MKNAEIRIGFIVLLLWLVGCTTITTTLFRDNAANCYTVWRVLNVVGVVLVILNTYFLETFARVSIKRSVQESYSLTQCNILLSRYARKLTFRIALSLGAFLLIVITILCLFCTEPYSCGSMLLQSLIVYEGVYRY